MDYARVDYSILDLTSAIIDRGFTHFLESTIDVKIFRLMFGTLGRGSHQTKCLDILTSPLSMYTIFSFNGRWM